MQSSSRNRANVRLLVVHTTEGIMRAADLRAWTTWAGSSHASADETGVLLSGAGDGFVDYDRSAWTMLSANPISDQIELCAWAKWKRPDWLARPLLLDACARWLAARSLARGIPLVHLTVAEIRAGKPGVIGHIDWTRAVEGTHTDPGDGFPWEVVLAKARAYAGGSTPHTSEEDDMSKEAEDKIDTIHRLLTNDTAGVDRIGDLYRQGADIAADTAWIRGGVDRLVGAVGPSMDGSGPSSFTWVVGQILTALAANGSTEISAEAIAAAIPADIAEQVAQKLADRLAS